MNVRLNSIGILVFVFAAACAGPSGQTRTQPASSNDAREVHIAAAWMGDDLEVEVEVEGDRDGVTHFYVPRLSRDLVVKTSGASFVEVEGADQTAVSHRAGQTLRIEYTVDLPEFGPERPAIILGADLWFLPWESEWRATNATFDLRELSRRPGIHSVESGSVRAIVPELRRTVHVFGADSDREAEVAGCRLRIWAEPGANVDVGEAIQDGVDVLRALDEYWGGGLPSSHLVVFTDGRPDAAGGARYSGLAKFQAALISDEAEDASGEAYGITAVMAHELTHHYIPWVGVHEQRWFTEGITDFIGQTVAIRAGVLPVETYERTFDYAAWLHDELRDASAPEDEKAYERATGFLLAHRWAARYGHESVRRWVVEARRQAVSTTQLAVLVRDMLSIDALEDLERAIIRREPLTFESDGCLRYGEEAYRPGGNEEVRHHATISLNLSGETCPFVEDLQ